MKVFSNLAISLDGKIAQGDKATSPLGTPLDRATMQKVRARCDVIVVGAGTLRAHPKTMKLKKKLPKTQSQPANAIISASGNLDSSWEFWEDPQVIRLVFTTQQGASKALAAVKDRALVIVAGEKRVSMKEVLAQLKRRGFKNVLVEGGGQIIGEFLQENLLQEMFVTLTPWILGEKDNPSLVQGERMLPWRRLQILSSKKVKDEIYLHYKIKGALRV